MQLLMLAQRLNRASFLNLLFADLFADADAAALPEVS